MRALAPAVVLVLGLVSCHRVTADEGRDASLLVKGGQFFRMAMPDESGGPAVRDVSISPIVRPGASDRRCSGTVDPSSTAVALALRGDLGYWIIPAGVPDIAAPGYPSFATEVSFATSLGAGEHEILVRAVDEAGRFGPPSTRKLNVAAAAPEGRLVVALAWGNAADLDLHVVDPNGVEIFNRNINSYEPPGPGAPPEAPGTVHVGGVLDFDANAQCVLDGRRAEHVVWADAPPSGHYVVRVDTPSLCGEPNSRWRVEATLEGARLGGAEGVATEYDTRAPHQRGGGVQALEFDVP